jgi:hypothetical protein
MDTHSDIWLIAESFTVAILGLFESSLFLDITSQLQLPVVSARYNRHIKWGMNSDSGLVGLRGSIILREEQDSLRLRETAHGLVLRGIPVAISPIEGKNIFQFRTFEGIEI